MRELDKTNSKSLTIKLPIKTVSEANVFEHWTKKHQRHKRQKITVYYSLVNKIDESWLPCQITLTRIAPRALDTHDNLPMSFKYILDSIASLLVPDKQVGRADDDDRIYVKYNQRKGDPKEYAIEIQIKKII